MNDKDQENGALRGPLIFTVAAYGFVMALYLALLPHLPSERNYTTVAEWPLAFPTPPQKAGAIPDSKVSY
ncbi:MAG: hypothetical protein WBV90_20220 [Terrimicrobiaceae bacterium]